MIFMFFMSFKHIFPLNSLNLVKFPATSPPGWAAKLQQRGNLSILSGLKA